MKTKIQFTIIYPAKFEAIWKSNIIKRPCTGFTLR